MLVDLVVDTNVLMHADDPRQAHQADALGLLTDLVEGTTVICVDEGFDVDEAKNASLIGGEYFARLTAAHTATAVLAHLFAGGRIAMRSRSVGPAIKKCIEQSVRTKRDRTFLFVTHNSAEALFCSHDYRDMQRAKRRMLRDRAGIRIMGAAGVRRLF